MSNAKSITKRKHSLQQSDDTAPKKHKTALAPQVQARIDAIRMLCPHLFLTPADVGVAFTIYDWPDSYDCATYEGIVTEGDFQGHHKFCYFDDFKDQKHFFVDDDWLQSTDVRFASPDRIQEEHCQNCYHDDCRFCFMSEEEEPNCPSALGTWTPGDELLLFNTPRNIGKVFNFKGVSRGSASSPRFQGRFEGIDDDDQFVFWTPGSAGFDDDCSFNHRQPCGLIRFELLELVRRISDEVTSRINLNEIPPEVTAMCDSDDWDAFGHSVGIANFDDALHEYINAESLRDFAREPFHTKQAKDVKRRFRLRAYVRAVGLLSMIARDAAHRVFTPGGIGALYAANEFKSHQSDAVGRAAPAFI